MALECQEAMKASSAPCSACWWTCKAEQQVLHGTESRINPHVLVWAGRCLWAGHRWAGSGWRASGGTSLHCRSSLAMTSWWTAGLNMAGAWSIGFQWGSLALALILSSALARSAGMHALAGGLVASRFGLWAFDLAVSQMLQERVPSEQLGEALLRRTMCRILATLFKFPALHRGHLSWGFVILTSEGAHTVDWHHCKLTMHPLLMFWRYGQAISQRLWKRFE